MSIHATPTVQNPTVNNNGASQNLLMEGMQ